MAVAHRPLSGLLACLLCLTAARLSESIVIATSSSNLPPFSLHCGSHYLCTDRFQKLVSVKSVSVGATVPNGRAVQCPQSERTDIGFQAEVFLNGCARGGNRPDSVTLQSNCIAQAKGQVDIDYSCVSAAITSTTPVNDVTGDGAVSTWSQQQGSSSQSTVAATAAAVVLSLTACSVAGTVLVCWRSGLFCFAARNAASRRKAPAALPSGGTRISADERQPAGRHYACTTLVQPQQHGLQTAGNQHPLVGANAPSSPAVVRYFSLTEQEDHCYEALPEIDDAPVPSKDQPVIYDEAAISSSPELPSHFLRARDSAGVDAVPAQPRAAGSNIYFTVEPPAESKTGGVEPQAADSSFYFTVEPPAESERGGVHSRTPP